MIIQLLNLNPTCETAPLRAASSADLAGNLCTRSATTSAAVSYCTTHAGARGTTGFWLNAPIFAMKHHSPWTRPD